MKYERFYGEVKEMVVFETNDESTPYMFASPVRMINNATGMYTSSFYSLMQRDTSHLYIVNAGHRPAKIVKDTIIMTYAQY